MQEAFHQHGGDGDEEYEDTKIAKELIDSQCGHKESCEGFW